MSAAAAAPSPNVVEKATTAPAPSDRDARWQPVLLLPCALTVDLAVPGFKVSDFLALHTGSIIGTQWGIARDVPLRVNGTLIAWGELEGSGKRLAVRLTELA